MDYYDGDRYDSHSAIATVHRSKECEAIEGTVRGTRYAPDSAEPCGECHPLEPDSSGNSDDSGTCKGTTSDGSECTREVESGDYCWQHS